MVESSEGRISKDEQRESSTARSGRGRGRGGRRGTSDGRGRGRKGDNNAELNPNAGGNGTVSATSASVNDDSFRKTKSSNNPRGGRNGGRDPSNQRVAAGGRDES
jgi:hypothetical protein